MSTSTPPVTPTETPAVTPTGTPPAQLRAPTGAGTLRVVGLVLVLGLLSLCAASVVVQFFAQTRVSTEIVTTPVTRLVTSTDTGNVRVHVGEPGQPIRVVTTLHWSFHLPRASVSSSDGTLTVTGACSNGFELGNCSVDLDVTVPAHTAVELSTSTGDIRVAGLTAGLTAKTETGDILLTGVGSQDVNARTDTGDVMITSTGTAPTVEVATSTGNVNLRFNTAPASVHAGTSTGDITLTAPAGQSYLVLTRTDIGTVRNDLAEDPASPHRLDLRTHVGDIRLLVS